FLRPIHRLPEPLPGGEAEVVWDEAPDPALPGSLLGGLHELLDHGCGEQARTDHDHDVPRNHPHSLSPEESNLGPDVEVMLVVKRASVLLLLLVPALFMVALPAHAGGATFEFKRDSHRPGSIATGVGWFTTRFPG